MKHLVFPTYELAPINPGGAGVLISGAVRSLSRAGYRCTVLCDFPEAEVAAADRLLQESGPNLRAVSVDSLGGAEPVGHWGSEFERRSEGFRIALARLQRQQPIDLIEFPEYVGMGYATLRARHLGEFPRVRIAVRLHGSMEFIDEAERLSPISLERLRMYHQERLGMKLADALLAPSSGLADLYRVRHGFRPERIEVSPPPMEELLKGMSPAPRVPDPGHFLFYGKLQEVKGVELLAQAAAALIAEDPETEWRFTLVGRDNLCNSHGRPMSHCISAMMPGRLGQSLCFVPPIRREDLGALVTHVNAAVIPSRFESFCLAAHELRALGVPLVVPDFPAFSAYLKPETGALPFDGTALGLKHALRAMRDGRAGELARRPAPRYPRFADAYDRLFESPLPTRDHLENLALASEMGTAASVAFPAPVEQASRLERLRSVLGR